MTTRSAAQRFLRSLQARARYAEHGTGRGSRPTNERLAADTGLSVRTVQRADTALRLLGVATEVLRGRQRTRAERLASWRVGDRGRGWASVWALHDDAQLARLVGALSPHPEGSPVQGENLPLKNGLLPAAAALRASVSAAHHAAPARTPGVAGWPRRGAPIRTPRRGRAATPSPPGRGCWPPRHATAGCPVTSTS